MQSSGSLPLSQISELFSDYSFPLDDPLQTSVRAAHALPAGVTSFDLELGLFHDFALSPSNIVAPNGEPTSNLVAKSSSSSREDSKEDTSIMKGDADPKRDARLARKRLSGKKSREKQKIEIQEAERRVQQLREEFSRLQMENGTLELKKSVLSTVLHRYDRLTGEESTQSTSPAEQTNIVPRANILQRILKSEGFENAKNFSINDFILVWKKILFEGSRLVCSAETHNEDALRILPDFVHDIQEWYEEWTLTVDDATFLQLLSTNMESGDLVASAKDHWVRVARSLQLTPQQKTKAWHAVSEVSKLVEKARQDHSDAGQGLKRLVSVINEHSIPQPDSEVHEHKKCREMGALTDELYAIFNRSKGSWQRRARLATDLADAFIFRHVLTSRQALIAAVNSFPYMLDSVSLLSGLSAALQPEFGTQH